MDTLLLLELTDNLTEALAGLEKAKDDTLATLDAIDAVNEALIALGVKVLPLLSKITPSYCNRLLMVKSISLKPKKSLQNLSKQSKIWAVKICPMTIPSN